MARGALINQALILFVVTAVAAVVAIVALRVGVAPLGTSAPSDAAACALQATPTNQGALGATSSAPVVAKRTWVPLGLVCTIKQPADGQAPLVVPHQSWPATITVLVALFIASASLVRLGSLLRLFARTGRVFA